MEECHHLIQEYYATLHSGTDLDDPEQRNPSSTQRYGQDIRWLQKWLWEQGFESPTAVTESDGADIARALGNYGTGTTGRYRWDRLVKFYDYLIHTDELETNPLTKWDDSKVDMFGLTKTAATETHGESDTGYAVREEEVRAMEEAANSLRDRLLIRFAWQTGGRRSEISHLRLDDIDLDDRTVDYRDAISKGGNGRIVTYQPSLDGLLSRWLQGGYRAEYAERGDPDEEWLFVGERGARLRGERINEIIRDAAIEADINEPVTEETANDGTRWKISSHSLRRGFATYLINETEAGLYEVSVALGHESTKVTEERYVERDREASKEPTHRYGPD